jgi:hypothetical protein
VRSVEELADEITTLASHISAATARWLALLVEFDARSGRTSSGAKSLSRDGRPANLGWCVDAVWEMRRPRRE